MKRKMLDVGHLGEGYEAPWVGVRGVVLCENIADCQSPVRKVTLEAWEDVTPDAARDFEDMSFLIWE